MALDLWRRWRRRRVLARADTSAGAWARSWNRLPLLTGLMDDEAARLRELAAVFLAEKALEAVQGLTLAPWQAGEIALQACLPVLNLGPDWHRGWYAVVVYPDAFVSEFDEVDEAGVVHRVRDARAGESWEQGPVILSWSDVEAGAVSDGYNVVIHEIAHKLDALSGDVNGSPPLHRDMDPAQWAAVWSAAFDDLNRSLDAGEETVIDPYAAESPAECFAVMSEAFFEIPALLRDADPDVYEQLRRFYRQDPAARAVPA